jgi:hypothetical protein
MPIIEKPDECKSCKAFPNDCGITVPPNCDQSGSDDPMSPATEERFCEIISKLGVVK